MMASTYPTSLDTFTNPTATSLLTSPSHAQQHSDINDAVEALETKVAIGNTVLGVYQSYTPTWTNLTIGNATQDFYWARVNNLVHVVGVMTFGTTTSLTGNPLIISVPVTASSRYSTSFALYGIAVAYDLSAATNYEGVGMAGSTTGARLRIINTAGTYAAQNNITTTIPFTWTTGDVIGVNFTYEAA